MFVNRKHTCKEYIAPSKMQVDFQKKSLGPDKQANRFNVCFTVVGILNDAL